MKRALKTPYTAPVSKEIRAQICQMIMQSPPPGGNETPGYDDE